MARKLPGQMSGKRRGKGTEGQGKEEEKSNGKGKEGRKEGRVYLHRLPRDDTTLFWALALTDTQENVS